MAEVTREELDDQLSLCRQRFEQVLTQIRAVLTEDLGQFPSREAKRAFVSNPKAAEDLSDAQIGELKKDAQELGVAAASRIDSALQDPALWLQGNDTPEDARSLVGAGEVWAHVSSVESDVTGLLDKYGLLGADAIAYRAPAYFVSGLYLPTLVEHYWKLRDEMSTLEREKTSLTESAARNHLESRWEQA